MTEIIVTTRAELQSLISSEMDKALERLHLNQPKAKEYDSLTIDGAVAFLADIGYPLSKNTINNMVSKGSIPFAKFGKKRVFSRKELLRWVDSRTEKNKSSKTRQTAILEKHANRTA